MEQTFIYMVGYNADFKKACRTGWGCGYVAIPESHPFFKENFSKREEEGYFQLGGNQEITFDKLKEIAGKRYWVLGFDTAHSYNDDKDDFDYVLNETMKLKAIVDSVK